MTEYPKNIKFKYPWRKYQQRVLDDLEKYLDDEHLHVVAPPGSGKTVLGLEVAIRLNKPTLILAPTIAIRNQWIQRFCELFLQTTQPPDWISQDIRNPKFLTVATYQGLHAACNNLKISETDPEEEEGEEFESHKHNNNTELSSIAKGLLDQKVGTIVVDEVHHLRNEWWSTLSKIKEKLNPNIVGLTATPPYDTSAAEWHRYIGLNGFVDTEISVPELITEENLCPHQDYVHFSTPTEIEQMSIDKLRDRNKNLFSQISTDQSIVKAIENFPAWMKPLEQTDWIYDNFLYYSACLIFMNANEKEIPKSYVSIVGKKNFRIPNLDHHWLETLLEFYLIRERKFFEKELEEHQIKLENQLKRNGVFENGKIDFSHNNKIDKLLASSIGKLNSIKEIVDFEHSKLGKDLRLVVLTDFIRKEYFALSAENNLELNKIGVIPIFENLRRNNTENRKIGILTGSIVIIPTSAHEILKTAAAKYGIESLSTSSVQYDSNYLVINQNEQIKHNIVHLITQIFEQGEIEVLIGTKSLLGEGWDAPAINTLILASFVGSFMLSNQMRGRAIRTQKNKTDKTGNIWHLVCIDPTVATGGDDFEKLQRRFRNFVGISFDKIPEIENNIGRLNLPESFSKKEVVDEKNAEMFASAADRASLKKRWSTAISGGKGLVEQVKILFTGNMPLQKVKTLYLRKTIANLAATLTSAAVGYAISVQNLLRFVDIKKPQTATTTAIIALGGAALFLGAKALKTFRLWLKYRDISKDIKAIGETVLISLIRAKFIHTPKSKLKVHASADEEGTMLCFLFGGTTFEEATFMSALNEIINPIENPRYVIKRKSHSLAGTTQEDYHAVPEILGRNKRMAEYFESVWKAHVGRCELIYTRTPEGRKLLLRFRAETLSAQFQKKSERISKWR
ncbi:MAG: DEAD/DEAH box helicase family protein [Bacteroidales bacterium]